MAVLVVIDVLYFIMDIFMYVCNFEYVSTIYKKSKVVEIGYSIGARRSL